MMVVLPGFCFECRSVTISRMFTIDRWGIGLDFRSKEPSRNLFYFFDRDKCAVREGATARKGEIERQRERAARGVRVGTWSWSMD